MGALRPWHIAVLVVVMILLFGAKRLPDAARSLGRSLRIIKAETKSLADDDRDLAGKADAQAGYQPYPPQQPQQAPQQPPYQGTVQPPYQGSVQQPVADPVQRVREN
ncbi:Sec-independent protein translocase subunit TatA [Micromonospora sp. NPDC002389]|uniref:Sec-independent protein translocase subunit TatA n=1 Tax=unclassified Micromonospora TaxID=2617518 RepID=UPI001033CEC0|nr:Sec-independent protein translocase subunit TatA [Verrucosispora sp. SN26_14.1]TBL39839.1 Sec-independent protein translocase subunit TatA [Verrucosispora sp. SN26_14.1]